MPDIIQSLLVLERHRVTSGMLKYTEGPIRPSLEVERAWAEILARSK